MKSIKTYERFILETLIEFDPDFALSKIKDFYSQSQIEKMIRDEVDNWVEDTESSEYENPMDWYSNNGSGEVEEIVIDQLMDWYEREYVTELTDSQRVDLSNKIIATYSELQF